MNRKNNDNCPVNHYQGNSNEVNSPQSVTKRSLLFSISYKLIPFSILWVSLVLMYGVICMYTNSVGQDEFYRFIFFLRHPFVVALNLIALLVAIFHSIIWFKLAPKALPLAIRNKRSFAHLFTLSLWIVTIAISIFLVLFVLK